MQIADDRFLRTGATTLPETRDAFALRRNSDGAWSDRKNVRIPALEPRAGHHHTREKLERRLRAVRGDCDPARNLPENFQPDGSLRRSFDHVWAEQSRDGLRARVAGSAR